MTKISILPTAILVLLTGLYGVLIPDHGYPDTKVISIKGPVQDNEAPRVKILYPKTGDSHKLNTRITYKIEVSDKEDGVSKYDEITSNEVLVEVRYVSQKHLDTGRMPDTSVTDPGLLGLAGSNCLLCHEFRGKLIGPSFYEIGQRYKSTGQEMQAIIAQRIIEGSTGIWGEQVMPSHPELSSAEVDGMLQWINKFATQEGLNYYHGLEGTLELKPVSPAIPDGVFVITSAYRDHGIDGRQRKSGQDRQVLSARQ